MLTKLIIAAYAWLLEIALWLALVIAGVVGYHITVPVLNAAGVVGMPEFAWQILGAFVFPVVTFPILAAISGPLLLLIDVRQAARNIEARLELGEGQRESLPYKRREPFI